MSNAAQCSIFDRNGTLLAEIEPDLRSVSWRLNNIGRAKFAMPYADPKCTKDNLQPGNRLLIEFESGLPNWGGVIDLPRTRMATGVEVSAYSGEVLLAWRGTTKGRYFSSQEPGYIFDTLISEENTEYPTGIEPYGYYGGGTGRTLEYHYHQLLKRVQDLADLAGNDFYVEPRYENGVLSFRSFWYERRGSDLSESVFLIEDKNIRPPVLDEQGPIYNRIILVGEGTTWGSERLDAIEENTTSRATYGYREYAEVQTVKEQATLDANAAEMVSELAYPRSRWTITALDKAPARFSSYDVGSIITVEAFLKSSEWAESDQVRVIAREWQPDQTCRLEVETWLG